MKQKIQKLVLLIFIVLLASSGLFAKLTNFFTWLITLNYSMSDISFAGEIFVKVASFIISYGLVGLIYDLVGFHDKVLMSWSYYIISTLLSFALSYIVMILETYLIWIVLIFFILLSLMITLYIIVELRYKKAQQKKEKI